MGLSHHGDFRRAFSHYEAIARADRCETIGDGGVAIFRMPCQGSVVRSFQCSPTAQIGLLGCFAVPGFVKKEYWHRREF